MHASKRLSLLHALLRVASISDYLFLIHLVILLNALGPRRVVKPKSYTFPFLSPGAFSLVYSICFSLRYESLNSPLCRVKHLNLLPRYLDSRPRGRKY